MHHKFSEISSTLKNKNHISRKNLAVLSEQKLP